MKSLLIALALTACGPGTERPACAPQALVLLETAYVSEVLTTCAEHKTPEECPEYPAIKARFEQKRAEWEACK
jgi:hypothetical protein